MHPVESTGIIVDEIEDVFFFSVSKMHLCSIPEVIICTGSSVIVFNPFMMVLFASVAPLVKIIYTSIKDFMSAFVGKEKKFTEPVLVKVNVNSDLEMLGFITQHDLTALGINSAKVAVYIPYSYTFS